MTYGFTCTSHAWACTCRGPLLDGIRQDGQPRTPATAISPTLHVQRATPLWGMLYTVCSRRQRKSSRNFWRNAREATEFPLHSLATSRRRASRCQERALRPELDHRQPGLSPPSTVAARAPSSRGPLCDDGKRRPECRVGIVRVGPIVHVGQHRVAQGRRAAELRISLHEGERRGSEPGRRLRIDRPVRDEKRPRPARRRRARGPTALPHRACGRLRCCRPTAPPSRH
jgi:hypothetical protein